MVLGTFLKAQWDTAAGSEQGVHAVTSRDPTPSAPGRGERQGISVNLCAPSKVLVGVGKPALNTPQSFRERTSQLIRVIYWHLNRIPNFCPPSRRAVRNSLIFNTELQMTHPQKPCSGQPSCWESSVVCRDVTLLPKASNLKTNHPLDFSPATCV